MKTWSTIIKAICPITKELKTFCGQNIQAPTKELAHEYCQNNGLGYLIISDELIKEIPCKPNTTNVPDWNNATDYTITENN